MPILELPHTAGCFVCGRDNTHGLSLALHVDSETGTILTTFSPESHHIGFQGIIHGGILSTVIDEAMVWSAIWFSKRSCLAAELSVRFKNPAAVGESLSIKATITRSKLRLIETDCTLSNTQGEIVATATGKYLTLSEQDSADFLKTFVDDPETCAAQSILTGLQLPAESPILNYASTSHKLVTIARFIDPFHANLAASCLDAEGVEVMLNGMNQNFGVTIEPMELAVAEIDVERARDILEYTPAKSFLISQ